MQSSDLESKSLLESTRNSPKTVASISCASSMISTGRIRVVAMCSAHRARRVLKVCPAVMRRERHAEDVAELAIKIRHPALRMIDGAVGHELRRRLW